MQEKEVDVKLDVRSTNALPVKGQKATLSGNVRGLLTKESLHLLEHPAAENPDLSAFSARNCGCQVILEKLIMLKFQQKTKEF